MLLLLDNYDSFTYNLHDYILQTGATCLVKRDNEISLNEIEALKPKGIIISPGPMSPKEHPILLPLIEKFYKHIPMLGICLGFQAMGEFFGAELEKAPKPVHGKTALLRHDGNYMFQGIPSPVEVTRYHSLMISEPRNAEFQIISRTEDGVPMAGVHRELPVWGVQFHPEAILTQYGLEMIRNWTELAC